MRTLMLSILSCFLLTGAGCTTTVIPKPVQSSVASYDGGEQNSGILAFQPDGSALITAHARDRYNALATDFGKYFAPPLKPDAGVTQDGDRWVIDAEHLVKAQTMNRWRKEGRQAKP